MGLSLAIHHEAAVNNAKKYGRRQRH